MGFYSYLTRVPCASPSPLGTKPPRRLLLLLPPLRRRYSQSRLRRARPARAAPQPALPNAQPFPPALRKWRSGAARPPLAAAARRTARPWPRARPAPHGAPARAARPPPCPGPGSRAGRLGGTCGAGVELPPLQPPAERVRQQPGHFVPSYRGSDRGRGIHPGFQQGMASSREEKLLCGHPALAFCTGHWPIHLHFDMALGHLDLLEKST
ncbi:sterile alpha motif domain-containing protein 1-like [Oenanthe melanoleuca]|uniref:sterile alpha motif domain-containing protein 1-like n=1 Tax=Oenanthe melanoleuca TaxID=2939378 RepID=UPI0024C151D9|nr:sterile alpha motif domain-containing protein 1-like [Oenanthe melanoleuca]